MSDKPRNPRYFPRMKVRGAHRRRIQWFQRVAGGFDRMALQFNLSAKQVATLSEAMKLNDEEMAAVRVAPVPSVSKESTE